MKLKAYWEDYGIQTVFYDDGDKTHYHFTVDKWPACIKINQTWSEIVSRDGDWLEMRLIDSSESYIK